MKMNLGNLGVKYAVTNLGDTSLMFKANLGQCSTFELIKVNEFLKDIAKIDYQLSDLSVRSFILCQDCIEKTTDIKVLLDLGE